MVPESWNFWSLNSRTRRYHWEANTSFETFWNNTRQKPLYGLGLTASCLSANVISISWTKTAEDCLCIAQSVHQEKPSRKATSRQFSLRVFAYILPRSHCFDVWNCMSYCRNESDTDTTQVPLSALYTVGSLPLASENAHSCTVNSTWKQTHTKTTPAKHSERWLRSVLIMVVWQFEMCQSIWPLRQREAMWGLNCGLSIVCYRPG